MKPAPFDYADPRSVEETLERLARHGDDAKVLAGGQSLVPMLNFRLARPAVLVDINRVAGLDHLVEADGVLHVGALVRQRRLERWAAEGSPLMATGLAHLGHGAIRNRGTVAGSIAHADPAAELPALLLCFDGHVVATRREGERVIPAGQFFVGPLMTALGPAELVTETRWTLPPPGAGWGFHEVTRRHGDFALVGAAALLTLREGRAERVRIALFGAGPTPVRAHVAETGLEGHIPTAALVADAARAATDWVDAQDDLHATAEYRRRVAATLIVRAVGDAVRRAEDLRR